MEHAIRHLSQVFIVCVLIYIGWTRQLMAKQFKIIINYKEMKRKQLKTVNLNAIWSTYN